MRVKALRRARRAGRAAPGARADGTPAGASTGAPVLGLLPLAVLLLALGGCHRQPEPAAPPPTAAAPKAPPKADAGVDPAVAEVSRTMATAVTVGPRTAPVEARYDLPGVPVIGLGFKLDLAVLPQAASPLLRVELRASEGLTVIDPVATQSLEHVQAGAVLHVPVTLQATTTGTHVLDVGVTLELPTGPESRTFAVPVIVASAPGK